MPLSELADYTQELLERQHEKVDRINSTHIGVENLFSEMWLLGDLKMLHEQVEICEQNPDDHARMLLGMTIPLMRMRNQRIAHLYPS